MDWVGRGARLPSCARDSNVAKNDSGSSGEMANTRSLVATKINELALDAKNSTKMPSLVRLVPKTDPGQYSSGRGTAGSMS